MKKIDDEEKTAWPNLKARLPLVPRDPGTFFIAVTVITHSRSTPDFSIRNVAEIPLLSICLCSVGVYKEQTLHYFCSPSALPTLYLVVFCPPSMADSGSRPPEKPPLKHGSYANVTASTSRQSNLPFDPKRIVPIGTHKEKDGQQVIGFSSSENNRLAETWKLTLIGKFSFAIPHPKGIASGFSALNLKGPFSWSFANPSHIIIKLHLEEDYNKLWMGTLWSLGDCPMRVFKWTPSFNPKTEAPLAPVWIRLPGLPIHFFDHNALFAICKIIGTPLQMDSPTATRTRLSMARVCVELELLQERVEEVILEFDGTTHVQKIVFERTPDYCLHCKHIGHTIEGCYMNGNKPRPPPPVRRPVPNSVSGGQLLKGTSGNFEKLRGAGVISDNRGWIRVNKKGPRETGMVSKDLLNIAKESKHTYFEANNSHIAESFSNQFSILENEVSQPLDALQKSINDPDLSKGLQSDVATISSPKKLEDNRLKGSYSTPSLSSFEKNIHTHGTSLHYNKCDNFINGSDFTMDVSARVIKGDNCGALSENIPPIISTATPVEDFIDQVCSNGNLGPTATAFHATKVVDDKASDIFMQENISPSTSPSNTAPLSGAGPDGFVPFLTSSTNNSCLAPPYNPSSSSLVQLLPSHHHLDIGCPLNGNPMGPTPTPQLAPKVFDSLQHNLKSDSTNKLGPHPLFSPCVPPPFVVAPNVCLSPLHSPANNHILAPPHHSHSHKSIKNDSFLPSSSRVAPIKDVGPSVFLSPFLISASIPNLDPPQHPPSSLHASHIPEQKPPDNLDQICSSYGTTHGPTPRSSHGKKLENSLLPMDVDGNIMIGPTNLGPDFSHLPTNKAGLDFQKAQEQVDQPRPAYLGQNCYLNDAQVFSSTPAQSSPAADGTESSSTSPHLTCGSNSSPNIIVGQAQSAESYSLVPDHSEADDNTINSKVGKNDTTLSKQSRKKKKLGVDKIPKSSKKSTKSSKVVHTFLTKGGGPQPQNRSGVSKSSSHSTC